MVRLLGIDVGTVRIGIALSDPLGLIAQPLEVIQGKNQSPYPRIAEIIQEYEVTRIVVGNPLQLNGEEGPAARNVAQFVEVLRTKTDLPVELWDERLSTAQADRLMINDGVRRSKRRQAIDKIAASLILQSYLDANPQ
ncbi:MAG: Holliday junction resolvase RuvX [Myxococcota bacterium]|nr:Holliday junction resolvase RuvX [Myxococcota bacterium]